MIMKREGLTFTVIFWQKVRTMGKELEIFHH